jgi:hypothetical protein
MSADPSCCQAQDCTVRLFGFGGMAIMGVVIVECFGRKFCSRHGDEANEVERGLENALMELHSYALVFSGLSHLTDHPTEFSSDDVAELMSDYKAARNRVRRLRVMEDNLFGG